MLDNLLAYSKLRTAVHTNLVRYLDTGEQLLKRGFIHVLGVHRLASLSGRGIDLGPDLDGTSQHPGASQVDIALIFEAFDLELLEEREGIVVEVIVVPLEAFGVMEDDVFGEGVVAIYDVAMSLSALLQLDVSNLDNPR